MCSLSKQLGIYREILEIMLVPHNLYLFFLVFRLFLFSTFSYPVKVEASLPTVPYMCREVCFDARTNHYETDSHMATNNERTLWSIIRFHVNHFRKHQSIVEREDIKSITKIVIFGSRRRGGIVLFPRPAVPHRIIRRRHAH